MRLEKWQWNSIIKAIEDAGLQPMDFDLDDDGDGARISLRGSGSVFLIGRTRSGGFEQSRVVGEGGPVVGYPHGDVAYASLGFCTLSDAALLSATLSHIGTYGRSPAIADHLAGQRESARPNACFHVSQRRPALAGVSDPEPTL